MPDGDYERGREAEGSSRGINATFNGKEQLAHEIADDDMVMDAFPLLLATSESTPSLSTSFEKGWRGSCTSGKGPFRHARKVRSDLVLQDTRSPQPCTLSVYQMRVFVADHACRDRKMSFPFIRPDPESPPTGFRAIQTSDKPLEFFNE